MIHTTSTLADIMAGPEQARRTAQRFMDAFAPRPAPRPFPEPPAAPAAFPGAPAGADPGVPVAPSLAGTARGIAESYPVDPAGGFVNGVPTDALLDRVGWIESRGNPNAVSPAGALGTYQILPSTGANPGFGVPTISVAGIKDPTNARAWAREYLAAMYRRYQNPVLAVAAYNAGPGGVDAAVSRGGTAYLPAETQGYINQAFRN